jgi:hypothetical protein
MFSGNFLNQGTLLNNTRFDITSPVGEGFDTYRFGARLTHSQTWNPKQVAKGQLLHSLPLAPGESTSVAVIDWTNKSSAATRQALSESEKVQNLNDRSRAIFQVANSVAMEFQVGSSGSVSESASIEAGAAGILPGFAGAGGASVNETVAATYTVSTGVRASGASLQEEIQDTTQQFAASVRSQRAAVVSEVSQRESEYLSTRSVTNYNHMHALSIQYYEVVQVYETQTRLEDFERCIYIPTKLIDFTDERNIFKYLKILRAVALDHPTRSALEDLEEASNLLEFAEDRVPSNVSATFIAGWKSVIQGTYRGLNRDGFIFVDESRLSTYDKLQSFGLNFGLQLNNIRWQTVRNAAPTTPIKGVVIVMEDGSRKTITTSASLNDPQAINPDLNGGASLSFGKIKTIKLIMDDAYRPNNFEEQVISFDLAVKLSGESRWIPCTFVLIGTAESYHQQPLINITTPPGIVQLSDLLMEHRLYYSQQVWLREHPQALIMQLAPLTFEIGGENINLVDYITPVPLTVVGNYVVYKFAYDKDEEWTQWVEANIDRSRMEADEVAIPTGGVFAEAVLGRFNAAEKLDATRFFNWKDSPPDAAPAIAALRAGDHKATPAPEGAKFDAPLVSIQKPLQLPEFGGLNAVLSALTTAELFRNMSGVANTGAAATAATGAASANSIEALTLAGNTFAKLLTTVANSIQNLSTEQGLKTLSEVGALLNKSKQLEKEKQGTPATTGTQATSGQQEIVDGLLGTTFLGDSMPFNNASSSGGVTFAQFGPYGQKVETREPQTLEEVAKQFPAFDLSILPPSARNCCAIFPGGLTLPMPPFHVRLAETQYLDIDDVPGHTYGSSGFLPADSVGHVYTARGGFVDLGHVRDLADTARFLAIQALHLQRAGGEFDLAEVGEANEGGVRHLIIRPVGDRFQNVALAALIGARAAYDLSIWHEIVTWSKGGSFNVRHSSFSPEDNFSNLTGALVGAAAMFKRGQLYDASVDEILVDWLKHLGAVSADRSRDAIDAVTGLWFQAFNDMSGAAGSPQSNRMLLRRHMIPAPAVVPWLVTDLHGLTFNIPDPVGGPGQDVTIDFTLGTPKPRPVALPVPDVLIDGLSLLDYYGIVIDVDQSQVPASLLSGASSPITSIDLLKIVVNVRNEVLQEFHNGDLPIDP